MVQKQIKMVPNRNEKVTWKLISAENSKWSTKRQTRQS